MLGCFGRTPPALAVTVPHSPCRPCRPPPLPSRAYHSALDTQPATSPSFLLPRHHLTSPHPHLATPVPLSFFHQRHRPLSLHLPASLPALLFRLHSKSAHHPRLARPPTCPPAFHTGLSKHISPTSLTPLSARSSSFLATSQASQQPWVTTTAHMAASFAA